MGKIQVLDEHMTNLIAAGEVIERCASVVKELVENSIDAGSTKINISLIDSGLNEIRVSDNGCGMDTVDAKMSVLPHATSKIKNQNDLFTIGTLGFRGEALASIVAVSNFRLITSTDGYHGLMLSLKGGVPISECVMAHPKGTEIIVKNLFFNTPARLQNLQNANVELSFITDLISKLAIANPTISFSLTNNNKEIIKTSGNGNLLEVISEVYSNDVAKEMVSIFDDNGVFKVEGYTTKISVTRSSKNNIILIINGRLVHNINIVNSVISGYGNLLMNGKYPISIININVDLSMVDVNVHPSKYEVRLSDEQTLKDMISSIINKTMLKVDQSVNANVFNDYQPETITNELISDKDFEEIKAEENESSLEDSTEKDYDEELEEDNEQEYEEDNNQEQELIFDEEDDFVPDDYNKDSNEEKSIFDYIEENNNNSKESVSSIDLDNFEEENITEYKETKVEEEKAPILKENIIHQEMTFNGDEIVEKGNEKLSKLFYIGQLFGTYILAQTENTFYLIDQHAANERINYEKIKKNLNNSNNGTYELLVPFTVNFSQAEAMIINEKMDIINDLGIVLDEFGPSTFIVRQIPIWIFKGREKEFVEEIITKIITEKGKEKADFLDSLSKSLACKKSIKGNEYHTELEIEFLLNELVKSENPFTCPHGRPIIVKIGRDEVEKWFKRIVD